MPTRKKKRAPEPPSVQRLRQRLRAAEETLDAIRDGQVEALVVRAPEGEQIYTLRSADQPYRLMVEQMREGAVTLSADGIILYCNTRLAELVALPSERITGQNLSQFVDVNDLPKLQAMLQADVFRDEFTLQTAAGGSSPAQ